MPHSITLQDPQAFREAYDFAQERGCLVQFMRGFGRLLHTMSIYNKEAERLDGYAAGKIWKDFAPQSFSWMVELVDKAGNASLPPKIFLGGGLIYHGPFRGTDDGTISVQLSSQEKLHEWSIHT